jgi:pseudouridine-5'-phosphate glycosidase
MGIILAAEVEAALAERRAVVALESTVIAHGLPRPDNLALAHELEAAVRAAGAVPATIAMLDGRLRVGLDAAALERIATAPDIAKCGPGDLAAVAARAGLGATTVAGTLAIAARAGIRIMATGGIGGVHRGGERSMDISADLPALAHHPLVVVCSGAKAILDLPRTLEVLETLSVPILGWRTAEFPAFFCAASGLPVARIEDAAALGRALAAQRALGSAAGILVVNPPPAALALDAREVETILARALAMAREQGIAGKAETPFLLRQLAEASGGRSLGANRALLLANARLAAELAMALSPLD